MAKKNKGGSPQDKLINLQAQQLAAQVANWAAQLEFQKERLRLLELPEMHGKLQVDIDRLAFDKGQAAWENAFKEASITGTYNGQPTIEWLTQQAQLTGVLNGQQTLQGKLTDAQIRQMNEQMRLANDEFISNVTGYYNGAKTFDREKFEAAQASDAWKFLATLTGPANAFKQARAIGSMPGGMRDLMDAWAGKYALPGSTSVGSGGPASMGGFFDRQPGDPGYQPPGMMPPGGSGTTPPSIAPGQPAFAPAPQPPDPVYGGPAVPAPGPAAPTPATGGIPGRGFPMAQWNAATHAAALAWNAAHPGYYADGSQLGYFAVDATGARIDNPPPPGTGAPAAAPVPTGHTDTSGGTPAVAMPAPDSTPSAAGAMMPYTYSPAGLQAPVGQWNYSANPDGSLSTYPPGVPSPAHTPDLTSSQPLSPVAAGNLYHYGAPAAPSTTTPPPVAAAVVDPMNAGTSGTGQLLPNQINARNYANSYDYVKELGWADFEDKGWDKSLAQEVFQRSLPKYTGPKAGSFAF